MNSGPFEWKRGFIGYKTRVEYALEFMTVWQNDKSETIRYEDIKDVYYYREKRMLPLMQSISLDIYAKDGRHINLTLAIFGFGNESFDVVKAAIAAFLSHYQAAVRDAKIHIGAKQSKATFAIIAVVLLFSFAFAAFQSDDEMPESWSLKLAVFATVFVAIMLGTILSTRAKLRPIDDVIVRLD